MSSNEDHDLPVRIENSDFDNIQELIITVRGVQVMMDSDLASLYGVETKNLNRAVKRNIERFPSRYMFQLTRDEYDNLRFQNGTSSSRYGGRRYRPYMFTEHGVAMLSTVLRSDTAVLMSIQIMDAFIAMRRFISNNSQFLKKLNEVEMKQFETSEKVDSILNALQRKEMIPRDGVFFNGQIFDAYKFLSDLIRSAERSLIIIDNYLDDSVLTALTKRKKGVRVMLFTKQISNGLLLDVKKFNCQYPSIEVKKFDDSHDRFIIIDERDVYHIGASLKDLGKKWFAFSRMEIDSLELLSRLKEVLNEE